MKMRWREWSSLWRIACLAAALALWARGALRQASAASEQSGTPGGMVIEAKGRPMVKHHGKGDGEVLRRNDYVYAEDVVVTGKGDRVSLALLGQGAAEIKIDEESEFTLTDVGTGDRPSSLYSSVGRAWAKLIGATHGLGGVNFQTPQAVAAVRGTMADVGVTQQLMTVRVYEGHVDVMNKKGKQSLAAGQMTSVTSPTSAPQPPRQMSPQDKQNWFTQLRAQASVKQMQALQQAAQSNADVVITDPKTGKKITLHFKKK